MNPITKTLLSRALSPEHAHVLLRLVALVVSVFVLLPVGTPAGAAERSVASFSSPQSDPNGVIDLPAGFTYRILAQAGDSLMDGKVYPTESDLNVLIPIGGGRKMLVTSHEINPRDGTAYVSRLILDKDGNVAESAIIADGMRRLCSGVLTPWGTVLVNEEVTGGLVYEVNPWTGEKFARPAMGAFEHESERFGPDGEVYLAADEADAPFFKFVAALSGDLSKGTLYALDAANRRWTPISDPANAVKEGASKGATLFNQMEGIDWGPDGWLYMAITGNDEGRPDPYGKIARFNPKTLAVEDYWLADGARLANPDNITFDPWGNLWIMEDKRRRNLEKSGPNRLLVVTSDKTLRTFAEVRWPGAPSPTGPLFDKESNTLYVNLQKGRQGTVLAITGFDDATRTWPPIEARMKAETKGDITTYRLTLRNVGRETVSNLDIRAAVPAGAVLLDTWAGVPDSNRASTSVPGEVRWRHPELSPGATPAQFVFSAQTGKDVRDRSSHAWVGFAGGSAVSNTIK